MSTRARIVTTCLAQRYFGSVERNREHALELLDLAVRQHPDLVCLPETFNTAGLASEASPAEPVPGPTTDAVAAVARDARCYVICPIRTLRDGRVYNSAVVLDREGGISGIYDKRRPVTSAPDYTDTEAGVTPGTGDGVFDLDFGRVALRICFDIGFPEDWTPEAVRGASVVLWPSAYDGGAHLAAYATLNRYYVISAVCAARSRIIDPCGGALVQTDGVCNIAVRDINLDYAVCHYDFNYGIPDALAADYGDRVAVRSYQQAGCFIVEPMDPSITITGLRERYGFEPMETYFDRHRRAYACLVHGDRPPPQLAAHGCRPMWQKPPRKV